MIYELWLFKREQRGHEDEETDSPGENLPIHRGRDWPLMPG